METLEQPRGGLEFRSDVLPQDLASESLPWTAWAIKQRINLLRDWRHQVARHVEAFCSAINAHPARTEADVLATEVLPLLSACRFLERNAEKLLAPRRIGWSGYPTWLGRLRNEVHRVPVGKVLIIGPSNYPLFLPGVQVLQALAAGNTVTWKPGRGGLNVADLFVSTLFHAGLPEGTIRLTADTNEAGEIAVACGADKVFFTGSARTGQMVMRGLAETATPSVMELSDSAAVVLLPGAEIERAVAAIVFGVRLNGSATCMAPRRLLIAGAATEVRERIIARLVEEFEKVPPAMLDPSVSLLLQELVGEAKADGATVIGQMVEAGASSGQRPLLVLGVNPAMRVAQADIFAPVLCVIEVANAEGVLTVQRHCPLALTVSIFGDEATARSLAGQMQVGTVLINDLIAPTADPRVPFGGRRASGFGVTRGAEGLLEMTAIRTVMLQRSRGKRHYVATGDDHARLFRGLVYAGHAKTWSERWRGLQMLFTAGRILNALEKEQKQKHTNGR